MHKGLQATAFPALLALALVLLINAGTPLTEDGTGLDKGDGRYYAAMSARSSAPPELTRVAPFCWRILTPFLASLFPGSVVAQFEMLAFVSNWIALMLVYGLLRRESLWLLLLLAGAALLFGSLDNARLFTYMLPAVVVLCVRTLAAGHPVVTGRVAAWLVVMLGLHLFLGYHLTPMGNVTEYLGRMVPMHGPYDAVRPGLIRVAAVTGAWLLATWLILPRTAPTT